MVWEEGRQGTGYLKKKLFQTNSTDCWLIKYPPNSYIPPHTDKVDNKKHYRLNIVLSGNGTFETQKVIFNFFNRVIFFRPDVNEHSMKNGEKTRLVFSFGFVRKL